MLQFADGPLSPLFTSIPPAVPEFPAASSTKETEPVKIAVLRGRHEIKLRIKQSESLHGPKVGTVWTEDQTERIIAWTKGRYSVD